MHSAEAVVGGITDTKPEESPEFKPQHQRERQNTLRNHYSQENTQYQQPCGWILRNIQQKESKRKSWQRSWAESPILINVHHPQSRLIGSHHTLWAKQVIQNTSSRSQICTHRKKKKKQLCFCTAWIYERQEMARTARIPSEDLCWQWTSSKSGQEHDFNFFGKEYCPLIMKIKWILTRHLQESQAW